MCVSLCPWPKTWSYDLFNLYIYIFFYFLNTNIIIYKYSRFRPKVSRMTHFRITLFWLIWTFTFMFRYFTDFFRWFFWYFSVLTVLSSGIFTVTHDVLPMTIARFLIGWSLWVLRLWQKAMTHLAHALSFSCLNHHNQLTNLSHH